MESCPGCVQDSAYERDQVCQCRTRDRHKQRVEHAKGRPRAFARRIVVGTVSTQHDRRPPKREGKPRQRQILRPQRGPPRGEPQRNRTCNGKRNQDAQESPQKRQGRSQLTVKVSDLFPVLPPRHPDQAIRTNSPLAHQAIQRRLRYRAVRRAVGGLHKPFCFFRRGVRGHREALPVRHCRRRSWRILSRRRRGRLPGPTNNGGTSTASWRLPPTRRISVRNWGRIKAFSSSMSSAGVLCSRRTGPPPLLTREAKCWKNAEPVTSAERGKGVGVLNWFVLRFIN